jgi:hypothetical protein
MNKKAIFNRLKNAAKLIPVNMNSFREKASLKSNKIYQ